MKASNSHSDLYGCGMSSPRHRSRKQCLPLLPLVAQSVECRWPLSYPPPRCVPPLNMSNSIARISFSRARGRASLAACTPCLPNQHLIPVCYFRHSPFLTPPVYPYGRAAATLIAFSLALWVCQLDIRPCRPLVKL
jgi:hypothetical protein